MCGDGGRVASVDRQLRKRGALLVGSTGVVSLRGGNMSEMHSVGGGVCVSDGDCCS